MLRTGLLSVSSTHRITRDQSRVVIRGALRSDLAAIEALLSASDLPTVGVADALDHFLLAEHEGRVIGAIGMELHGNFALLRRQRPPGPLLIS